MTQDRIGIEMAGRTAHRGEAARPLVDAARLAAIFDATFSAENHESLDAATTRLMLDLSNDTDLRHFTQGLPAEARLRLLAMAVLMVLRRR